jgi:hypothetical protein
MMANIEVEFAQMMLRCSEEIRMLRNRVNALEPKAHAYDQLSIVLGLLPKPPQAFTEDILWRLDKRIQELTSPVNETSKEPTP